MKGGDLVEDEKFYCIWKVKMINQRMSGEMD